jgi:hypothetical protein
VLDAVGDGAANTPATFVDKARVLLDTVAHHSMCALLKLSDSA